MLTRRDRVKYPDSPPPLHKPLEGHYDREYKEDFTGDDANDSKEETDTRSPHARARSTALLAGARKTTRIKSEDQASSRVPMKEENARIKMREEVDETDDEDIYADAEEDDDDSQRRYEVLYTRRPLGEVPMAQLVPAYPLQNVPLAASFMLDQPAVEAKPSFKSRPSSPERPPLANKSPSGRTKRIYYQIIDSDDDYDYDNDEGQENERSASSTSETDDDDDDEDYRPQADNQDNPKLQSSPGTSRVHMKDALTAPSYRSKNTYSEHSAEETESPTVPKISKAAESRNKPSGLHITYDARSFQVVDEPNNPSRFSPKTVWIKNLGINKDAVNKLLRELRAATSSIRKPGETFAEMRYDSVKYNKWKKAAYKIYDPFMHKYKFVDVDGWILELYATTNAQKNNGRKEKRAAASGIGEGGSEEENQDEMPLSKKRRIANKQKRNKKSGAKTTHQRR